LSSRAVKKQPKIIPKRLQGDLEEVFFSYRFLSSILIRFFFDFASLWPPFWESKSVILGIDFWMIFACRSKIVPRAAKSGPRAAQEAKKGPQKHSKGTQEHPKRHPSRAKQSKAQQSKAEQSRARQSRAEQSRAKLNKAKQGRAKQSKAKQGRAKQSKAKQSRIKEQLEIESGNE